MSLTRVTNSMISGAVVNVLDFGAVGDYNRGTGVGTDSTASVLAAIAFAQNQPIGDGVRVVYFPAGSYKIASTLSISSCSLLGEGAYASVLHYTGTASLIYCAGGNNRIESIGLYGSNTITSIGVSYDRTLRHRMVGCNVFSFNRGVYLHGAGGTYGVSFHNNYFAANVHHVYAEAVGAGQFPTTCWFVENEFITGGSSASAAIYLQDCNGFTFERNVLQGNPALYTIHINYFSAFANAYANHRIINNWFEENGNSQVGSADVFVQGNHGAVKGVIIENNQHYTTNGNNPTYGVIAENTNTLSVRGNTWNLGSPWTYLHKSGVGNYNWDVSNPCVIAAQELVSHKAAPAMTVDQTFGAGVSAKILFDTEVFNSQGLWDTTNSWYLVKADGTYSVTVSASFANSDAAQVFMLYIYVNGVTLTKYLTLPCIKQITGLEHFTLTGNVACVVGDKITFVCENTGASARNLTLVSQASIVKL